MKKGLIIELLQKFEQAEGVECWSTRELKKVFNYTEWRNFLKAREFAIIPAVTELTILEKGIFGHGIFSFSDMLLILKKHQWE